MIYLVRHLEKTHPIFNPTERSYYEHTRTVSLTEGGRLHAMRVAMFLQKKIQTCTIVSSDFTRAQETAYIIGEHLHVPPLVDPRLSERVLCANDVTPEKISYYNIRSLQDWSWRAPGGESMRDVAIRMRQAVESAQNAIEGDEDLVVISHSRAIQAMLGVYFQNTPDAKYYLSSDPALIIDYGAVIQIDKSKIIITHVK